MILDLRQPVVVNGGGLDAWAATMAREQAEALAALGGGWRVPGALVDKVDAAGRFRPFFGDSVILPLAGEGLARCGALRDELTRGLSGLFAEPLPVASFHLTVHDLAHGTRSAALAADLERNRQRCRSIFEEVAARLGAEPELARLQLRPMRVYPCLNISLLLGLVPATEADFRKLMSLYAAFDALAPLDYWLRPHVTLAYFRPTVPDAAQVQVLAARLMALPALVAPVTLDLAAMRYVRFRSMADYEIDTSAGIVWRPGG